MIKIHQISKINIQNNYQYIFNEYFGNGYFNGSLNGNGNGSGNTYLDGNGDSCSFKILIRNYKND